MKSLFKIFIVLVLGLSYLNTTLFMDGIYDSIGLPELVNESKELYHEKPTIFIVNALGNILPDDTRNLSYEEYRTSSKSSATALSVPRVMLQNFTHPFSSIARYISFETQHFRSTTIGYLIYLFRLKPF